MTIEALSKYFSIKKQISQLEDRLKELEQTVLSGKSLNIVNVKTFNSSNPVEEKATNLIKLKSKLQKKYEKLLKENLKIENYINTITDVDIQSIIRMRFLECKTWNAIAKELMYSRTSPYMKLKRYLECEKEREKRK